MEDRKIRDGKLEERQRTAKNLPSNDDRRSSKKTDSPERTSKKRLAKNGVAMDAVGRRRAPIGPDTMRAICRRLEMRGQKFELYILNDNLPLPPWASVAPRRRPPTLESPPPAQLLVVRNYLQDLLAQSGDNGVTEADRLLRLVRDGITWDRMKLGERTKKLTKSRLRENNCFADVGKSANIPAGQGTVIPFADTGKLTLVRDDVGSLLGQAEYGKMNAEGNKYDLDAILHDDEKRPHHKGCGWHGDDGRNVVVGLSLGMSMDLHFAWYYDFGQVANQTPFKVTLRHGDLYVMGDKTTGTDWKTSKCLTVRHACGDPKCTMYKPKKRS